MGPTDAAGRTRTLRPASPLDLSATLGPLRRGGGDPAVRRSPDGSWWRATATPDGAALLHLRPVPSTGELLATAWGPGSHRVLDGVPGLVGEDDDPRGFVPHRDHPALVAAHRRRPGVRVPRTRAVLEALAGAAVEQVVTSAEATSAWRDLLRRFGEGAPGAPAAPGGPAAGMHVPPTAREWAAVPDWEWLRAGVELRRRAVVRRGAASAAGLERTLDLPVGRVEAALRSLPGVGVWTAAEVRHRAHGDPDAFSFADFHVPGNVSWALTGEVLDDAGCAEVVERYRGHRYRVQRLVELAGLTRPRRGPRMRPVTHVPRATGMRS